MGTSTTFRRERGITEGVFTDESNVYSSGVDQVFRDGNFKIRNAGGFDAIVSATNLTANRTIQLPNNSSAILATDSTSTVSNKTFSTGNSFSGAPTFSNVDIILGTAAGTKIGTATTQKLAFWNATPVAQPAANADTSGAVLEDLETEVNQIKALLRTLGLMAT